jgi:hypothetical protein
MMENSLSAATAPWKNMGFIAHIDSDESLI